MDRQVAACPHPEAVCPHPEVHPAARLVAARRRRAVARQMVVLAAAAVAAQATLAQSRLHPARAVAAVDSKVTLAVVQKVVVT